MKATENTIGVTLDRRGIDHRVSLKDEGHYKVFSVSVKPENEKRVHSVLNNLLDADQFYEVLGDL